MKLLNKNSKLTVLAMISIFAVSGCMKSKPDMYYWGAYESMIQRMYTVADEQDPESQITQLESDIQQAEATGRKVPPGLHAHIGFLHAAAGNTELSIKSFEQEKSLFPESAHFIDGMMNRAFKGNRS